MTGKIISKIGMLLILIGFFMPASCSISSFDVIWASLNPNNRLDIVLEYPVASIVLLFALFISICIGVILLILFAIKNTSNNSIDKTVSLSTIISSWILIYIFRNYFRNDFMQTGPYVMVAGSILTLVGFLIDLFYFKGMK